MCRPWAWLWGLIPLAAIMLAAILLRAPAISDHLGERAHAELDSAGHDWAVVEMAGRDAVLSGIAPDEDALATAHQALAGLSGLRRVADATGLPPVESPYRWWAERVGESVRLGGHVPSMALRNELLSLARDAFPGSEPRDEMAYARGAPDRADWDRTAYLLVESLRRMTHGRAELEDDALTLTGRAADIEDYERLPEAFDPPPSGFRIAALDIEPAVVAPHRFEARMRNGRIGLSGHVPSEEASEFARGEAGRMRPDMQITAEISVAAGPVHARDWVAAARYALGQFALLADGSRVAIVDDEIVIEGRAADQASYQAILSGRDLVPPGFTLQAAVRPPASRIR